jgi:hypothetical protein
MALSKLAKTGVEVLRFLGPNSKFQKYIFEILRGEA